MRDSAAKNMGKQFDEAIQFGALYKALKKCCRGVRWKPSTAGYEHYALANTYRLRQELLHGSYKLSSYQRFTIREPKVRDIVATRPARPAIPAGALRRGALSQHYAELYLRQWRMSAR